MIKYKKGIENIFRLKNNEKTRENKLRLDKNERIKKFEKNFLKNIFSKLSSEKFTNYPEVADLYNSIAKHHKLNSDKFVITAGIDGAIKNCFELFVSKKDKIIVLNPTFAMVDIYCKIFGAKKINITYDKKVKLNVDFLLKSINKKPSLIILANPNSPTGTLIDKSDIKKILKKANIYKIPVFVDEAYYDFSKVTVVPLLKKYKNLIVGRTFSKGYGLAGLRVGYIITNPSIAKLFFNLKPMYEVNSVGILISKELLKKQKIYKNYLSDVKKGSKLLINYLKKNNILYFQTYANFIYINLGKKINYFQKKLNKAGILTKNGMGVKGYENYLRITLGPPRQMKVFISKLKKLNS